MSSSPPVTNDIDLQFSMPPPPPPPPKPDHLIPQIPHASEPTPTSPSLPDASEGKQKRNPLTDLVETEKVFVELLTGIIRKVAAAWSRTNLPPPELDSMFRSIETIYRASRVLHAKLKVINADPRSAGELGGLLIQWIDDLKDPYGNYCSQYRCGFDNWEPVISNPRLANTLALFSETNPASSNDGLWTLDSLFLLPKTRLTYYLKLYKRLLKNTQNPLLFSAVETLKLLLDTFDNRSLVTVGDGDEARHTSALLDGDEVVIDMRTQMLSPPEHPNRPLHPDDTKSGSETSSNRGSGSAGERSSRETQHSSYSRTSLSTPITDLERRLSVDRTLDIFTMTSKAVKLQMLPPSLTFTREMRIANDVVIRFTPRATGVEVVHRGGHIFILSDLFLICERMKPEERQQFKSDGPDMWLCYPPLAGKVLRVSEIEGQLNMLQVAIMKKEFLILETTSREERDRLIREFKDCIEFSSSVPAPSKNPPPPLPPFNAFPRLQSDNGLPPIPSQGNNASGNMMLNNPLPSNPPPTDLPPPGPSLPARSGPLRTSASAQQLSFSPLAPGPIPPARSTSFVPGGNEPQRPAPGYGSQNNPYPPAPSNPNVRLPPNPYPPGQGYPQRPPSAPAMGPGRPPNPPQGPMPPPPQGYPNAMPNMPRSSSFPNGPQPGPYAPRPVLPSQATAEIAFTDPSPPNSPEVQQRDIGPVTSTISAQMKCKVFLQQQHAQWKALGPAKLKLYRQDPTNIKQLVVEADNKDKSVLISTIVLTDGVERVGKTGVAIELSDKGARTGIVYMIQLRNETSAGGLFDSLLAGSDRSTR